MPDAYYKIIAIQNWAEHNAWFNSEFVDSVYRFYNDTGMCTISQENALDNIIIKCKIVV